MIQPGICHSFKEELLQGIHRPTDEYRVALYGESAPLSPATTVYTPAGEAEGKGYYAGGKPLEGFQTGRSGAKAWIDWTVDPSWQDSTVSAAGALIYNASKGNRALVVLRFLNPASSVNGAFDLVFPDPAIEPVIQLS